MCKCGGGGGEQVENLIIIVNARFSDALGQLCILSDRVADLHTNGDAQCFPLYLYEELNEPSDANVPQTDLFGASTASTAASEPQLKRRDAITDEALAHFEAAYPGEVITKEEIFYYVYGILHSPEYRERYADNLGKELPRIPRVKRIEDFRAFSEAGRALGALHINYESVPEYKAEIEEKRAPLKDEHYRVEKMKFGKGKDKSIIHYNAFIKVKGIPLEAYDYIVNGKSAIEWVMERQSIMVDKKSGIVKDANDYALETVGDPRYPLSLLLRVITVSLETNKLVNGLPSLDLHEDG